RNNSSLRAQRSNPLFLFAAGMDCFAALAMTVVAPWQTAAAYPPFGRSEDSQRGMCFAPGREAFLTPPATFRGERHVAWNDTHHHPDHFPVGRLQRPIWRLWLWHGAFRHGDRWRDSGGANRPDPAGQAVGRIGR